MCIFNFTTFHKISRVLWNLSQRKSCCIRRQWHHILKLFITRASFNSFKEEKMKIKQLAKQIPEQNINHFHWNSLVSCQVMRRYKALRRSSASFQCGTIHSATLSWNIEYSSWLEINCSATENNVFKKIYYRFLNVRRVDFNWFKELKNEN